MGRVRPAGRPAGGEVVTSRDGRGEGLPHSGLIGPTCYNQHRVAGVLVGRLAFRPSLRFGGAVWRGGPV